MIWGNSRITVMLTFCFECTFGWVTHDRFGYKQNLNNSDKKYNLQNGSKSTHHKSQTITLWTRLSKRLFPQRSARKCQAFRVWLTSQKNLNSKDGAGHVLLILGDPGAASRAERKGATKFFKHGSFLRVFSPGPTDCPWVFEDACYPKQL